MLFFPPACLPAAEAAAMFYRRLPFNHHTEIVLLRRQSTVGKPQRRFAHGLPPRCGARINGTLGRRTAEAEGGGCTRARHGAV